MQKPFASSSVSCFKICYQQWSQKADPWLAFWSRAVHQLVGIRNLTPAISEVEITSQRRWHCNDECFLLGLLGMKHRQKVRCCGMWQPWLWNSIGMLRIIGVVEWAGFLKLHQSLTKYLCLKLVLMVFWDGYLKFVHDSGLQFIVFFQSVFSSK